jgi:hypothetical protein
MCWIEVPNYTIAEEVRARLESDPSAVVLSAPRGGRVWTWTLIAVAFITGAVVGWLGRY